MSSKGLKKVLIIKLGAIGDVVHTMIIPAAIKQKHPDYEIHYMTSNFILPMIENSIYIDKVIGFDDRQKNSLKYLFSVIKDLQKEKYDIIFCLSNTLRLLFLSTGACPKKIGFRKCCNKSWVEEYFYSAKKIINDIELPDKLTLNCDPKRKAELQKEFAQYPHPHIVLNPGAYYSSNRAGRTWDIEKWKDLSERILQTYGGTIFVNGSQYEYKEHIKLENDNVKILSGKYSLADSCIVLSLMDLVISGDSGPVHIASAYDVKTLALLGSTSPDKIKPYGNNGYFVEPSNNCKYCWKKKCKKIKEDELYSPCIESISVVSVTEKIKTENLL